MKYRVQLEPQYLDGLFRANVVSLNREWEAKLESALAAEREACAIVADSFNQSAVANTIRVRRAKCQLSTLQMAALMAACLGDIPTADATGDPLVRALGTCIRLCAEYQAQQARRAA